MYTDGHVFRVLLLVAMATYVSCDYDCLCNYAIENRVYPSTDTSGKELGYLYEFDCKPLAKGYDSSGAVFVIQFQHQVAYVEKSEEVTSQICSGEIPTDDVLTTTPAPTVPTTSTQAVTETTTTEQKTSTQSVTTTTTPLTRSTGTERTVSPATSTMEASTLPPSSSTTRSSSTTQSVAQPSTESMTSTISTIKTTLPFNKWYYAANVTGTVYEYIGTGYSLLNGNPNSYPDPGLNSSHRIFQLSGKGDAITELAHQRFENCLRSKSTSVILGSKSYQQELEKFARPSATHEVNLLNGAFTLSKEFGSLRPVFEDVDNIYIDHISTCKVETIRYLTENADQNNFTVSLEFAKSVCSLPTDKGSDLDKYLQFLDTWGTSIVTSVDIGNRTIQRESAKPQDVFLHMQQTDPGRIQHTGEFHGFKSSITINKTNIESSPALNTGYGMIHTNTIAGREVIGVDLIPITDALNWTYWKSIAHDLVAQFVCPESILTESTFNMFANNMNSALQLYPGSKHTPSGNGALKDHDIRVPITWPVGTYGFMESKYGCPDDGKITWSKGRRHQDTEDVRSHNSFTAGIENYMKGSFGRNNIDSYYCIKNRHNISPYDQDWPRGAYCLLKKGACPIGFRSGYIFWDDDDIPNHNSKSGTLPDGTYDDNTKIYYCCRSDGSTRNPIYLPTERPFILVRYGDTCQMVHGMDLRQLYVMWDDEDLFNSDSAGGMHPKDDGDSNNHKLHFCYYQSTAHGAVLIG